MNYILKSQKLLDLLACPVCKENIQEIDASKILCPKCKNTYLIKMGIPDMVINKNISDQVRIDSESDFFDKYGSSAKDKGYQVYEASEYGRILDLMSLKQTNLQEPLLSVGCGSGVFEGELKNRGYDVYGIDLSFNLLSHCSFPVVRADALNLPFVSGGFRHVFCAGIMHHIPVDLHSKSLMEMKRILSNGGKLYIFEPKINSRSRFLHPVSQFLKMRTKGEEPIGYENFLKTINNYFPKIIKHCLVHKVKFVDLNFINKLAYEIITRVFELIPWADNDEFFLITAQK